MATDTVRTIEVENVNHPGLVHRVGADKYEAMKKALLKVLPDGQPGATVADLQQAARAHLPETLFPGGATAGWWFKTVQLDLEAKGVIAREKVKPLRLRRA